MSFALMRIGTLPPDFTTLRETAEREDFQFLGRLGDRWNGARYQDDALATIWGAEAGGELVAIGAQTYDEYDPSPEHRRIRHFYVRPDRRRMGIGCSLAQHLVVDAFAIAPRLHLRATHAVSSEFWDAVGFARVDREDRTHEMLRGQTTRPANTRSRNSGAPSQ
jgi:GNAT superfamily N-acetyltransferase